MNKEAITKALALLKYTYPSTFKDYTKEDMEMMIIVWLNDFKDDDVKEFEKAINRLRKTSKWCPSISEIKYEISKNINPYLQLDVNDEWSKVISSIRKYGYNRQREALEEMNDITREIVKTVGWYRMCMSENIEYERKTFYSMFENKQKRIETASIVSNNELTLGEKEILKFIKESNVLMLENDNDFFKERDC